MEFLGKCLELMYPIILFSMALYISAYVINARREAMKIIQEHPDEIEHVGFLVRRMIYRIKRKRKAK